MLYVGAAYGFWTQAFVSSKGNKGKIKVGPLIACIIYMYIYSKSCWTGVELAPGYATTLAGRISLQGYLQDPLRQDLLSINFCQRACNRSLRLHVTALYISRSRLELAGLPRLPF